MIRHPALLSLCLGLSFLPAPARASLSRTERPSRAPLRGHSGALRAAVLGPGAPVETALDDPATATWVPVAGTEGEPQPALGDDGLVRAPESPGSWQLEERGAARLTALVPVDSGLVIDGMLNGYRIGSYPRGSGSYAAPRGYLEVTREAAELRISDSFRLGQFLTKGQADVWPKYLVLDLALVDKLELVLRQLRADGVAADAFHVMSGYRTPSYNGPGGKGRARNSRHLYGDAADLWIDQDGDGQMDDLDGDGSVDRSDARVILAAVEQVERRFPELVGGAGIYRATRAHGPFIHVDTRGRRARW